MKKSIIFFILLFTTCLCSAQNYNCFVPGARQYFINANNYLRGMRIDSVRVEGSDTVYYPFHTPRGKCSTDMTGIFSVGLLDTNGGSWLGKKVIKQPDGTFLFDNLWGDTVVIKTQANIGDMWIFFRDTSLVYIRATLSAIDTETILSVPDSVKIITLNVYDTGGMISTNHLNNAQIILSKNHGFVQTIDLYTLPYPSNLFANDSTIIYDYYMYKAPAGVYNLVSLLDKTYNDLFQWNLNDVFQYEMKGFYDDGYNYASDTVKGIANFPNYAAYNISQAVAVFTWIDYHFTYKYVVTKDNANFYFYKNFFIDTTKMPEEFQYDTTIYYYPNDSSLCIASPLYNKVKNDVYGNKVQQMYLNQAYYKIGIGLTDFWAQDYEYHMAENRLAFYSKSGISCGGASQELKTSFPDNSSISIFPNPASSSLTIKLPTTTTKYNVTIINTLGQCLYKTTLTATTEMNVSNFPPGIYNVQLTDAQGGERNEKVVITH